MMMMMMMIAVHIDTHLHFISIFVRASVTLYRYQCSPLLSSNEFHCAFNVCSYICFWDEWYL